MSDKKIQEMLRDADGAARKGLVKAQRRIKEDKQLKRELVNLRGEYARR